MFNLSLWGLPMRLFINCAFYGLLILSGNLASHAQRNSQFHFQFTDAPGPYVPGFKVVEQYDRSRSFTVDAAGSAGPRPLQTLVWYPAAGSSSSRMTIGDYAALVKTEISFNRPVEQGNVQEYVATFTQGTTALSMRAVRGAQMIDQHYPVVIYAPSVNAPASENLEFCEYLASYGFVVIASPDMGASSRKMTLDVAGANAEARDISFAIDFAKTLPDTDMSKVAVVGYSWGAMGGLFATARDKCIGALVSLDGSLRYGPLTVQQAGDVHPEKLAIPLLVFSPAEEPLENWEANHQMRDQFCVAPSVLNEWILGDVYHLHMLAMSHIEFSSLYQRSQRFQQEALQFSPADYSLEEGGESYNWVAKYMLAFLQVYLEHDASALTFLRHTPMENGVPRHLIAMNFRAAVNQQDLKGEH